MRAPRSLRARITLAAVAALALGALLSNGVLLASIERDGRRAVDRDLRERAGGIAGPRLAGLLGFGRPDGPLGSERGRRGPGPDGLGRDRPGGPGGERLLAGSDTFVQVAVGDRVIEQRGDVPADAPPVPARGGLRTVDIGGVPWRALTVVRPRGDVRVQILSSLEPVEDRVADIRGLIALVGLAALALTALAAWGFTTLAVRPLARLRAGAARVGDAGDLRTPLPDDDGPDEVRSLARALNDMLARLEASTDAMQRALQATRRFAADAGHELRTPLTGLRANLDTLQRNPDLEPDQRQALIAEITAEQERIVHLLEGLQALARGEAAESLPRERVELGDLVDTAVVGARRRHPGVGYELADRVGDGAVFGWPGGLRLVVDNLLDNAARHGRADGRVRVIAERAGATLTVRVEDDGPGIPAPERERLLEPFARGPAAGPGTGLGLAIVAQQVGLHDGDLRLADSELGGLAVEVRLPATAAASAPGTTNPSGGTLPVASGSDAPPDDSRRPAG